MKQLLEYISRSLTENEDIQIQVQEQDGAKAYTIVAPKDVMGILIGKEGKTIRAIRALARARAIVDQEKVFINLLEKEAA
ncbi:MAG: hypothetical protein A3D38_00390 [Candidatus Portnoybacteria bacterium RIFCSPHIGHO2_02_FULL_40_23]|nr:MAG: hypothetical protein A3D38_00390 [Candidatus Portnoybacteria bacterium RIFCSPHIGHO2_02_FULL_40_23]